MQNRLKKTLNNLKHNSWQVIIILKNWQNCFEKTTVGNRVDLLDHYVDLLENHVDLSYQIDKR